ncbi:MAG: phosphotransferase family protein, partial [Candidatus Competibacterales bacterium]
GFLEWEFAACTQPLADVGWFGAPWWGLGGRVVAAWGVGSRGAFYRGYSQASGLAVDATQVPYWEVMALIRWAIIALQQGERFRAGEPSLELLLTGTMAVELEAELLRAMAELGP